MTDVQNNQESSRKSRTAFLLQPHDKEIQLVVHVFMGSQRGTIFTRERRDTLLPLPLPLPLEARA